MDFANPHGFRPSAPLPILGSDALVEQRGRDWRTATALLLVAAVAWIATGDPWTALAPAMLGLAIGLLAARDRFAPGFLAPNPKRDVRAAVAFGIFFGLLLAVPLDVAAVRAG